MFSLSRRSNRRGAHYLGAKSGVNASHWVYD
jgi:hypothetical protein